MGKLTPEELRESFWRMDAEAGGVIGTQYSEIKRVLKERDFVWIKERYRMIKKHAIEQTEYYMHYDIEDEFPVVNKSILTANKQMFSAKGAFQSPIHIASTSGSTGIPFSVIQDYRKRKRTIADLKVFGELCDYPSHERMVFFRVINDKVHRTPEQEEAENIFYVDSSDLGIQHLEEMKQVILEKKPRIVFSYASTLVELAKYIDRTGIPDEGFSMKSVLTGGEGISEQNRQFLEQIFNCTVYRRYSDMELGILGQDSGNGSPYFLNWGSYFFECLKLDVDEPVDSGEPGRIIVTDLFNYAFPMIRYDTGDLGIMEYGENGELPGLREIYGRKRDCIYTVDGKLLSPAAISVMMWGGVADGVKQWQFIQEDKNRYILKLNCSKRIIAGVYIQKFKSVLGKEAQISVEYVQGIPIEASNKQRAVICNYRKG